MTHVMVRQKPCVQVCVVYVGFFFFFFFHPSFFFLDRPGHFVCSKAYLCVKQQREADQLVESFVWRSAVTSRETLSYKTNWSASRCCNCSPSVTAGGWAPFKRRTFNFWFVYKQKLVFNQVYSDDHPISISVKKKIHTLRPCACQSFEKLSTYIVRNFYSRRN